MSMSCHGYQVDSPGHARRDRRRTLLGLHVRDLLAYAGTTGKPTAEHVILFWNGGGMTHIDTWDPKPGRPTQGEFEPIKTSRPGRADLRDLPRAGQADAPRRADPLDRRHQRRPRPGHLPAADQLQPSPNLQHPGIGSVVVHEQRAAGRPAGLHHHQRPGPAGRLPGPEVRGVLRRPPGEKDPYLAFPAGIAEVRGNKRLEMLAAVQPAVHAGKLPDQRSSTPRRPRSTTPSA